MTFRILIVLAFSMQVFGQVPIPKRSLGFVYKSGNIAAPIQLDVFVGPLCSDSRDAFPTILQLADSYGSSTVILRMYMFPLPYHRNAFLAAKGAFIVDNWSAGKLTYKWLELIYDNMDKFSNAGTYNKSDRGVISLFAEYARRLGMHRKLFLTKMKDGPAEGHARTEWKYTCTRGIAYAPAFMINGIIVEAEPTWSINEWKQVIDPLLGCNSKSNSLPLKDQPGCSLQSTQCQYLPRKSECCGNGRNCISNVGCRSEP